VAALVENSFFSPSAVDEPVVIEMQLNAGVDLAHASSHFNGAAVDFAPPQFGVLKNRGGSPRNLGKISQQFSAQEIVASAGKRHDAQEPRLKRSRAVDQSIANHEVKRRHFDLCKPTKARLPNGHHLLGRKWKTGSARFQPKAARLSKLDVMVASLGTFHSES
jgi:hypothetical protein